MDRDSSEQRSADELTFRQRVQRGRAFEAWERSQWTDDEHRGVEFESAVRDGRRRRRIDIKLDEATKGAVVVVETKATDWDRMAQHRVRPNVLRHARQVWRYIEAELRRSKGVFPALVYPSAPRTPGRKEEIEAALHARGIEVIWRGWKGSSSS
jgi:hypothetical protein